MARWVEQRWVPTDGPGRSRHARAGGSYRAFVPDPLINRPLQIPSTLSTTASIVERKILALSRQESSNHLRPGTGLEGIARFLLRSEALSSSRIEGIAPQPDKVAIAELTRIDPADPGKKLPLLALRWIISLRQASSPGSPLIGE